MPYYDYSCQSCDNIQEEQASIKDDAFRRFEPACEKCGSVCKYRFTPTIPQVAFKDGASGSWPSKGDRFQNYRRKRDGEMKKRQLDRYGPPKELIPNYQGQQCESWTEAKSLASKDTEKSTAHKKAAAQTFEKRVKKEPKKIRA